MKDCPKCKVKHSMNGKFCSRKCANSRKWTQEDKIKRAEIAINSEKVRTANNNKKGIKLGPMLDSVKEKIRKTTKEQFNNGRKFPSRVITDELRSKLRLHALKRNFGGYNPNSIKKHKKGNYKGYWCDSSWELAYVIYNLENNIKFERNTEKFSYILNGLKKNFIPDFILTDGTYVEIKGYMNDEAKAKIEQFNKRIFVIDSKEIKKYLDYVIKKYGRNFIELYETNLYVGDA